jgi:hypothetical protein
MNLKEIGILLVSVFFASSLLIGYKYYIAKGKVFHISRILIFKYTLRFILLLSFLLLCFYQLTIKQVTQNQSPTKSQHLFALSTTNSSLTWNSLKDKIEQMPVTDLYSLVIYNDQLDEWVQLIPSTNHDSFVNLIEHAQSISNLPTKNRMLIKVGKKPKSDEIIEYSLLNNQWALADSSTSTTNLVSNNRIYDWLGSSYLKLYIVIFILVLLFIDIVFTVKSIKI